MIITEQNNILDLIHWDILFALGKLNEQVERKQYKWLFIRANRNLFDIAALTNYIENNDLKNKTRVKDILEKAEKVIDLDNEVFAELEKNTLSEPKTVCSLDGGVINICPPFECITIKEKAITYVLPAGYDIYFCEPRPLIYNSNTFARRSANIINVLTAFYKDDLMNIYEDIVNRLYAGNTEINGTHFFASFDFIEARHIQAEFKGKVFYENILRELTKRWKVKTRASGCKHLSDESESFLNYCKEQIDKINDKENLTIKERDHPLDFYLNTPDIHFNINIQFWNFAFTGKDAFAAKRQFLDFVKVAYDLYFFLKANPNKPITGIEKIKEIIAMHQFSKEEE